MKSEILRMECISKSFPGVKALDNVSINVFKGEVLALTGENGAGKSSLMKVLAGIYSKDSGRIYFDEREVEIKSPCHSQMLGISFVHQELNLMPNLSAAENIFIGREKRHKLFFVDKKSTRKRAQELLEMVGLEKDCNTLVGDLSLGQRQMVEVAKALAVNARLIIMDEPTSSLTERETTILKRIILKLKEQNVSIIFISHKLDEVLEVADRITILKDGISMGTYLKEECDEEKLIALMTGRELESAFSKGDYESSSEILRVENISTKNLLRDISFTLRKGEILGFAGIIGSGRTELMNVLFGIDTKSAGTIIINGNKVEIRSPMDAIKNKIGLVPEERKLQGLILDMSIRENITLSALNRISNSFFINSRIERFLARHHMKKLKIKASCEEDRVINLSGGNQQKVVISKWLSVKPEILIFDEPTRGVDVAAKKAIHDIINALAEEGIGIILVSSELTEILTMSDRIIVMYGGTIKGELMRHEATEEKILSIAVG